MNIFVEIDGVKHKLVYGHIPCKDCSFISCAKRPYPLCCSLANMFGYHFEIVKK